MAAALSAGRLEDDSPYIGGYFSRLLEREASIAAPTICFYFTPFFGCSARVRVERVRRGNFTAFDRNLKSHVYPDVAIVARQRHTELLVDLAQFERKKFLILASKYQTKSA